MKIELIPAAKGTSLCVENEVGRVLEMVGIKDVYSRTYGQTGTKINLLRACFAALKELQKTKIRPDYYKVAGIVEGSK